MAYIDPSEVYRQLQEGILPSIGSENMGYASSAVGSQQLNDILNKWQFTPTKTDDALADYYSQNPSSVLASVGQQVARGIDPTYYYNSLFGSEATVGNSADHRAALGGYWDAAKKYGLNTPEAQKDASNWAATMNPEAQARVADAQSGGLFGDSILNTIGQVAAAYFGGPIGAAAYTGASGGNIEDMAKSGLLTYAGGQLSGTGSGAAGGSWYSPSGDIGGLLGSGEAAAMPLDQVGALAVNDTSMLDAANQFGWSDGASLGTSSPNLDMFGGALIDGSQYKIDGITPSNLVDTTYQNELQKAANQYGWSDGASLGTPTPNADIAGASFADMLLPRITNAASKIGDAIVKDPLRAAGIGMTAANILQNKVKQSQEEDNTYQSGPIDKATVNKYGSIQDAINMSGNPKYQGFQSLGGSADVQKRLNKMKGLL